MRRSLGFGHAVTIGLHDAERHGDCLLWRGELESSGYPIVRCWTNGTRLKRKARHLIWTSEHGEIPADHVLTATCNNRRCVEVSHLALKPRKGGVRR